LLFWVWRQPPCTFVQRGAAVGVVIESTARASLPHGCQQWLDADNVQHARPMGKYLLLASPEKRSGLSHLFILGGIWHYCFNADVMAHDCFQLLLPIAMECEIISERPIGAANSGH